MPSAFRGLGVNGNRRSRRGTGFSLALPVPVYRLRVQAVFGHLLHCGGAEPVAGEVDLADDETAPADHGR